MSPRGDREVRSLRHRLAREPRPSAVYCSPLRRALATAAAAPAGIRNSVRVLHSLAEIDCGRLEGLPLAHVRDSCPDLWRRNEAQADDNFSWPGGESYRRFRRRVLRAVLGIVRSHPGERVLIVTHAGVINQVLGSLAGLSAARWHPLRPRNASLTTLLWDLDGNAAVERFDDCAHL